MRHTNELKWRAISVYVDLETGEIISKSKYEREYYKIRTTNTTEKITKLINGKYEEYRVKRYTIECRPNRQQRIEFGTN